MTPKTIHVDLSVPHCWLTVRVENTSYPVDWHILGIYTKEAAARNRCKLPNDSILALPLDVDLPDEIHHVDTQVFPLAEEGVTKMRLGIVGSRSFQDYNAFSLEVRRYLQNERRGVTLVSGGAQGADSLAERFAQQHDIPIEVYRADWDLHGKRAGFLRNHTIVENSDAILAFWDGESKGTAHTISLAEQQGKPVEVIRF